MKVVIDLNGKRYDILFERRSISNQNFMRGGNEKYVRTCSLLYGMFLIVGFQISNYLIYLIGVIKVFTKFQRT